VFQAVPWAFRKEFNWIAREYNNPPVFVTENGFSDYGGLNDTDRVRYYTVSTYFALSILSRHLLLYFKMCNFKALENTLSLITNTSHKTCNQWCCYLHESSSGMVGTARPTQA
jgi:hypothetical protein